MPKSKGKKPKARRHNQSDGWEVQLSLGTTTDGRRSRKTIYAKTKAAAEAKAEAFLLSYDPSDQAPTGTSLAALLDNWFQSKVPGWRPRTQTLNRGLIKSHIVPALGDIPIEDVTPMHVQTMVSGISNAGKTPTANKCRALLFSAMKQAVRWEVIRRNPVEAIDAIPQENRDVTIWTRSETSVFLESSRRDRFHTAFALLVASGLRRGELLGLRWSDVTPTGIRIEQTVVIVENQAVFGSPKSKSSRRHVALDEETLELLNDHRRAQGKERDACGKGWTDHDLVFPTQIGTPVHPRNFRRSFDRSIKRAGVPRVTLHSLRHLHASLLIAARVDAKSLSERLGHSSVAFTLDRYGHIFAEHRQRTAIPIGVLLAEVPDAGS